MRPLLLAVGLFLSSFSLQGQEVIATRAIHLTLVRIKSHEEFKEITSVVKNAEGFHGMSPFSESPGLITLGLDFAGDVDALTQLLEKFLGRQYSISHKTLPTGVVEINVAKGS